jgi:glucose-6-phosphate isomerase
MAPGITATLRATRIDVNQTGHIKIDATGLLAGTRGESDIAPAEVAALAPRFDDLQPRLRAWRAGAAPSFLALPFAPDTAAILARARELARRFRRTIVFGIGGSSLGGEMLVQALSPHPAPHAVHFFDNVDPTTLAPLAEHDWSDTLLLVISKSGDTAEILSQFLSCLPTFEDRFGSEALREHILVVTENPRGALYQIADRLGLEILPHPPVGGRFSVLSVVGLLPAALAGVDIEALLAGARHMTERCAQPDIDRNPALWNAGAQYLQLARGRRQSVQMAYSDRLYPVTSWWRQLWGESLGKRDAAGRACGLTPVEARGVTDQHSQLQLYLDGPDDKQFTFLVNPDLRNFGARVPARFADLAAVAPLVGHATGELFLAEFEATRATLARHGRPQRTLALPYADAHALGELIVLLETETVAMAELLGVDPFDQPAVEEGKVLAREYLTKSSK